MATPITTDNVKKLSEFATETITDDHLVPVTNPSGTVGGKTTVGAVAQHVIDNIPVDAQLVKDSTNYVKGGTIYDALFTSTNINNSNSSDVCSNDLNNLKNGTIYGIGLTSGHSVLHSPLGNGVELYGQIITTGKQDTRTNSDTQEIVVYGAGTGVITIYKRIYWSNVWGEWQLENKDLSPYLLKVDGFRFITDEEVNSMLGTSKLASHINIPGSCLLNNSSKVTDLPLSGNWILNTYRYSTNYNIQESIGFDAAIRGRVFIRVVNRNNYSVFFSWSEVGGNRYETKQNITNSNSSTVCSNDLNNLANNKIYGLGLTSGHSVLHTPLGDGVQMFGQIITTGKQDTRTNSDTQEVVIYAAGTGIISVYKRIYWGDAWGEWQADSKPSIKILAVGDSIVRGYRNSDKSFVAYLSQLYKNISISGATVSNLYTGVKNIPQQLIDETSYEPDVVITNGGVNDYYQSLPLGNIPTAPVTTDGEDSALDKTSFCGGLQHLFYQMIKKYPSAQRFYVSPHKILNWANTANSAGYTFVQLQEAVKTICSIYNVVYVDVYNKSLINTAFSQYKATTTYADATDKNAWNQNNFVDKDGIHPADMGYKVGYVPIVKQAIEIGTKK